VEVKNTKTAGTVWYHCLDTCLTIAWKNIKYSSDMTYSIPGPSRSYWWGRGWIELGEKESRKMVVVVPRRDSDYQ
jgi:hypothetical protein